MHALPAFRGLARVTAVTCALAHAGCFVVLDHEGVELAARDTFIALQSDFEGFDVWPSIDVEESPVEAVHLGEGRRVYINQLPGDGALAFAVGTIIVKTGAGGELTGEPGNEVHAMVKRGAPFNDEGAKGWEWFELAASDDGEGDALVIVWRGAAPPSGHGYGCTPGVECDEEIVDCNGCHLSSESNDFVHTFALP